MKTFVSKFEKDLLEASQTNYGGGLNTGDAGLMVFLQSMVREDILQQQGCQEEWFK